MDPKRAEISVKSRRRRTWDDGSQPMRKTGLNRKQIEKIIAGMLEKISVELVDVEYHREAGGQMLRCYIDVPDGVGLDTCQKVSRYIMKKLEDDELIPYDYLEVSSPGLNRIIKKDQDFRRFMGERIRIRTLEPLNGQRNFTGLLRDFTATAISIENPDLEDEEKIVVIPRNIVSVVRLHPEM